MAETKPAPPVPKPQDPPVQAVFCDEAYKLAMVAATVRTPIAVGPDELAVQAWNMLNACEESLGHKVVERKHQAA